ncbi:MAG: glycerol kinase GlpK [Spirochaetales bacterium]|nr:glycerol kinase GlpK [Spirochaetales bacterium]
MLKLYKQPKEILMSYIIALDQGTTSSRALLIDKSGTIKGSAQKEFPQIYPQAGWVEHDPMDIWNVQLEMLQKLVEEQKVKPEEIAAIGITNQRETTIVWDRNTGKPVYNAIVWQCRRTADYCNSLKARGLSETIHKKTGLVVDAYFSGSKIKWILDNVPGVRVKAEKGDVLFGTVDTWLVWKLTGGKVHVTDYTNASRTMLFNINTIEWDQELLNEMDIPKSILPDVKPSSYVYGQTDINLLDLEIPIAGIAGDQQAALFGQMCIDKGSFKNTYGTGCFMLMNTGEKPVFSRNGLLTTIALGLDGKISYALEGSVFMAGAVIQWLRDDLKIIESAEETEAIALSVADTRGVNFVSAFQGLGTPYWDMGAKAAIHGLSRGAGKAHIVRAALESIAFRTKDIVTVMEKEAGITLSDMRVDGGACRNNFLMQFQSDILNNNILRPGNIETTAMGAAYLAGLAVGFWSGMEELKDIWVKERVFKPTMEDSKRKELYAGWKDAVGRCLT